MIDYYGQFFELSFLTDNAERYEHPPYAIKIVGQIYPRETNRN